MSDEPNVAGLLTSIGSFVAGIALMLDDVDDFGEIICEGCEVIPDAPHPHHGFIGALLMLGGIAGMGFSMLDILAKTAKNQR